MFRGVFLVLCLLPLLILAEEPLQIDLTQAECLAVTHNRRILSASQEVRQAYFDKLIALAHLLPRVTYIAQWNAAERVPLIGLTRTLWGSKFAVVQPLFNTDLYYTFTGQLISYYIQKADYLELENDLLLLARQLYYRLILDHELIAVAEHNVGLLQETLHEYQEKLEIGLATVFDVTQQEVALLQAMARYFELINAELVDRNNIFEVLGFCPNSSLFLTEHTFPLREISDIGHFIESTQQLDLLLEWRAKGGEQAPVDSHFVTSEELHHWDCLALEHRPAIVRSRLEIDQAQNAVRKAKGRYFPTLTAFAAYQANPPEMQASHPFKHYWWNGGLRLEWTLFDSGAREFRVAKACSKKRGARYSFEESVIVAKRDVRNSLDTLVSLGFEYNAAVKNVESAELNMEQADEMYRIGLIDTLNYLNAVQRLFEAQSQEKIVAYRLIDTYYTLRHVVGVDATGRLICYGNSVR